MLKMLNDGVYALLEVLCQLLLVERRLYDVIFKQKVVDVILFLGVFFSVHVCHDARVSA